MLVTACTALAEGAGTHSSLCMDAKLGIVPYPSENNPNFIGSGKSEDSATKANTSSGGMLMRNEPGVGRRSAGQSDPDLNLRVRIIYVYPILHKYYIISSIPKLLYSLSISALLFALYRRCAAEISCEGTRKSPAHAERAFEPTWGTQRKLSVRKYPGPIP